MRLGFDPALTLGKRATTRASAMNDVAARIRMILETRPGDIPWRAEFGCDLASIAGQPASASNVSDARQRVEAALVQWLPDVEIRRVGVRVVPNGGRSDNLRHPLVPLAETALLSLGSQARLEVQVEVAVAGGALTVRAPVNP
jgi:phage baseplate assembly protein W